MDEQDNEIDTELYIQLLLAYSGDKELKERVVERISKNTGLPPEKVELILDAALEVLLNNNPRMN